MPIVLDSGFICRSIRPNGQTPVEDMTEEERYEFMYNENVIMAKAMGGVPKKKTAVTTHPPPRKEQPFNERANKR